MSGNNSYSFDYGVFFWIALMVLTLNADNGKDMLDVLVPYVEAKTAALRG